MKKTLSILLVIILTLSFALLSCSPEEEKDSIDEENSDNITNDDVTDQSPSQDDESDDTDDTDDTDDSHKEGLTIGDINDTPPPSIDFDDLK